MNDLVIRDVPIRFPFKPYKVQEDYMCKVLECLQQGQNGLLESPTGTGKTLSLLCSSLAWLEVKKAQLQATAQGILLNNDTQLSFNEALQSELKKSAGSVEQGEKWSERLATPQIIYASRTHAQLTQAVKELKRTSYCYVKSAVLGSRDQLCLHPDLSQHQGFMKVALCRAKVKARSCHYHTNLEKKTEATRAPPEVLDIEDLMRLGSKTQCCPYFLARDIMGSADIVFMPYNYLLHPQTRRAQKINLNNAVVILDEAHNVEKTCEESASVHISSTDVALCITEVTQVMKKYSEEMNQESSEDIPKDFSMEDLCVLKTMFLSLETAIDEVELHSKTEPGRTFPGSFIFELLNKADIQMDKLSLIDNALSNLVQFLSTTSQSPLSAKGSALERFNEFLKVVFDSCGDERDKKQSDLYYKVYIQPEVEKESRDMWSSATAKTRSTAKVVNFWCFSPGFAMRSMLKLGVHCVILTSGTLSPLQATVSELGIPLPVLLENPHIVLPTQICAAVVCKGPTMEPLLSNYNNRENPNYMADLARMLTNFCRVIPDGILMFFSSYFMLEKTVDFWQEEGHWSQISNLKPLFVEPKKRESLEEVMSGFTTALEAEGSSGAVLLAVLRGKVSEGMDFTDHRCRAVIVTGLPYAPFKDPRVILKKEYADNLHRTTPKALDGRQWYDLDAVRAVNQALGRVIRHADDFGAILLCDTRFKFTTLTALSAWLRPHITPCQEFGQAFSKVSKFFKALDVNPRVRAGRPGASFDYSDITVRTKEKRVEVKGESEDASVGDRLRQFADKVRLSQPKTPQPAPQSLLQALDVTSTQRQRVEGVRKETANTPCDSEEPLVQPGPKRRKLRIVPLQFDVATDDCSETATSCSSQPPNSNKEYLSKVRSRLSPESFRLFGEAVKAYRKDESLYDNMVDCLCRVFPDSATEDLFIGFKKYVKPQQMKRFEDLCSAKQCESVPALYSLSSKHNSL